MESTAGNTQRNMAFFPAVGGRKREIDESEVEGTIQSPAAATQFYRGGPHKAIVKRNRTGTFAKTDLIPSHEVIQHCLIKRLAQKLPRDLLFVGSAGCAFKAPSITATAYSPFWARSLEWPNYAVGLAIDHIINNATYRLKEPLDRHQILYTTNPLNASDPAIPTGTAVAHVHLRVGLLAHDWEMEGLLVLAHNEIVQALVKPGQLNLDQFIHMAIDTGVSTDKYCMGARADDHWLRQILIALGTYGALNHDIWMAQDMQKYLEFIPKAPYYAQHVFIAQQGIPRTVLDQYADDKMNGSGYVGGS